MKKFWALLLAALLVVSILPVSALAADVSEPTPAFEQGTLTINVAFNGLPEDKIPESVRWELKKDGAHVQDVVITAAEKWTKSLTLDPGEYELHADVDSTDVGGYYHFYYSIIWATVTAGEDTKLDITETYEVQPVMSFDIPVEKKVELLGKSAPLTDTDFDFAFTLANDAGKTDMLKLYFDGKPVTDSFTMTVKAGETSAAGVLTVSGPVSQMYGLHGTLSEKAPAETGNWLYDSSEYRFGVNMASPLSVLEEEPSGEKLPAYITLDDENVDTAVFTNKYSVTTGTLTVTKSFEGLPKELIPASVTFELWQDKQHLEGQDITLTAADGWTKSVELEAGEYILKERTDGLSVDGYIMGAVEDIKAVVTAEEASAVKVVNTYKPEPIYSISIPVEKQVKQTGKHMPVADKTFDFALELSVKTGKLDKIEASFNGAPVTDGFALTVKAGETTASGVLTITGPASQMKNLEGKLTEVGSEKETKWTFDGSVYTFAMASAAAQSDAEAAEAIPMPAAIMRGDEQADKALFVNEYKSTEMKVSVVKKWNDKGSEDKRPESVTVQLFYYQKDANGKDTDTLVPYELDGKKVTAVLNEKNGWKCSFDGLDTELTWTVKETNVPSGYYFYVNRSSDGKTITVTNVYAATQKPKTGDSMMLWSVLALVSGSAAAAAFIFGKKRSHG